MEGKSQYRHVFQHGIKALAGISSLTSTHYLRVCCLQLSTLFQCPRVLGPVRTVLAVSYKVLALSQSEQVWTVELHFHLVSGRNVDHQAPGEQ